MGGESHVQKPSVLDQNQREQPLGYHEEEGQSYLHVVKKGQKKSTKVCNTKIQVYNIVAQEVINNVKTVPQKQQSKAWGFWIFLLVGFFFFFKGSLWRVVLVCFYCLNVCRALSRLVVRSQGGVSTQQNALWEIVYKTESS